MKTPVTFEANGYKYSIFATEQRVEVHAYKGDSGCVGSGRTFHEALLNLNDAMKKAPLEK